MPAGTPLPELVERPKPGIYDWDCSPYALELALGWRSGSGAC